MPHAPRSPIGPAAIVDISGVDACAFAQAQFSSNIATLQPGDWHWSAWLDAQGRARFVFALGKPSPDHLLAWLPLGDAAAMATALARFVFRSKVVVQHSDDWQMAFVESPAATAPPRALDEREWKLALGDPAAAARLVLSLNAGAREPVDAEALNRLHLAGIAARLPWLANELSGEFVGAALDLGPLGATRLDKGCYPGQEIVARLHYRGGNKRHLARLAIASDRLPCIGEAILGIAGDMPVRCGRLLYAATANDGMRHALAILDDAHAVSTALRLESGAAVPLVEASPQMAR